MLTISDTATFGATAPQYQRFTYDALDRVISATVTGALTGTYNHSYTYNAIGNLTSTSRLGNYTYPASGPTSVRPHAVTSAGSNS